jgi:DNA adenine methylase
MSDEILKAPFPWFGGKSRVAPEVWARFGDVANYVEPFFGSGAVLLGRPGGASGIETVNDLDGFVANFWRALAMDPDAVAHHADWPVNENDLHARHAWLVSNCGDLPARLEGDPEYHDAKIAGWWVWGLCCWIGSGWCSGAGPWQSVDGKLVKVERNAGQGVKRQRPHLGNAGVGVNRQLPHLGPVSGVTNKGDGLREYMRELSGRLKKVRFCCGDWSRVCGPTPTFKHGLTGVFLDPPYTAEAERNMDIYAKDCGEVGHRVTQWAIENGDNPLMRIALCGYEGEYEIPDTWTTLEWKAHGGYGNQGETTGRDNAHRERIWFSPHCLGVAAPAQFEMDFG